MQIAKVTCWVLDVPYTFPLSKNASIIHINFVEVETDEGLKGHAMARIPMLYGIRDFINREVAQAIVGMDPMRTEQVRSVLYWTLSNKYFTGAWSCAASLVDVALWDIKGKIVGQPLWKLLGGANEKVPAYITFGLPQYSVDELVEVARMMVAEGQNRLKMALAAGSDPQMGLFGQPSDEDILRDAERVKAVREAIGSECALMVDANKNPTKNQALRLAKLIEPYDIAWFEDPVAQGDPRQLAELRKETSIPIAAGSTGTSDLMYLREYLLLHSVDIIQPNVRDIGGYTGGLKAAALAQAFNVPMAMGGNWPHINLHLHGAVSNGGLVEFHLSGWEISQLLFDHVPSPVNGWVRLPDRPGLGFEPKMDNILDLVSKESA